MIRERTIAWSDPHLTANAALGMAGLDFMRGLRNGSIPAAPIAALVGLSVAEVDEGRIAAPVMPSDRQRRADRQGRADSQDRASSGL